MGRIIRRSMTITITETWTIVWATDDEPAHQATTTVPDPPKTQEEPDENLQATITTTKPDNPSVREPPATPLTPATTLDAPPGGATTGQKRKRSRGRRIEGNQRRM
jgi:hypothetical protein